MMSFSIHGRFREQVRLLWWQFLQDGDPLSDPDDRLPGVVMRILAAFGAIVVATAATTFERIFQNAVEIKSENDLAV